MSLCQIVWISEAARNYSRVELLALLAKSRTNNVRHAVTGLLLYHRGSFMQFMEGEQTIVDAIFENRIRPSTLHQNVTVLLHTEIDARIFGTWSMGFMTADTALAHTVPGFRDFIQTQSSFLELAGDTARVTKLIDGFHAGLWHLHEEGI